MRSLFLCSLLSFLFIPACTTAREVRTTPKPLPAYSSLHLFSWMIADRPDYFSAQLQNFKKAGITNIVLAIRWSDVSPQPHQFDFSQVDAALQAIESAGLTASLFGVMHEGPPAWFAESYPDQLARDTEGRPMTFRFDETVNPKNPGNFPSPASPVFREHFKEFIVTTIRRYKQRPSILSWQFNPGQMEVLYLDRPPDRIFDYSAPAQDAFRNYLRSERKLSTLEAVNARYGTHFESWNQVTEAVPQLTSVGNDTFQFWKYRLAERPIPDLRRWMEDTIDFKIWLSANLHQELLATIRSEDSTRPVRFNIDSSHGPTDVLADMFRQQSLQVYAGLPRTEHLDTPPLFLSLLQRHHIPNLVEAGKVPPDVNALNGVLANLSLFGGNHYLWVNPLSFDNPAAQILSHFPASSFSALVNAEKPSVQTVVVFSFDSRYQTRGVFHDSGWDHRLTLQLHQGLAYSQIPFEAISDYSNWATAPAYRLLIDTESQVLRPTVIAGLAKQVREGACLVITPLSGYFERGSERTQALIEALNLPIRLPDPRTIPNKQLSATATKEAVFFKSCPPIPMIHVIPLRAESPEAVVEAVSPDGEPLAVRFKVGRGQVLLLAGRPDWSNSARPLLESIATTLTLTRPVTLLSESSAQLSRIRATCLTLASGKEWLLVLDNDSDQAGTIRLQLPQLPPGTYQMTPWLGGDLTPSTVQAQSMEVPLAGFELRLLHLRR